VGEIVQADFLTWKPGRQYDVVASFGFIEHFEDPADIVARHFALTKPGGYVVLEMPNFARGQKLLNSVFNPQTIKACNTSCMNLRFFEKVAAANNAKLQDARFVGGGFSFFIRDEPRPLLWQRILWRTQKPWEWLSKQFPNSVNSWFSPYMIGVFQVPGDREA
jgi:SAM-dependent methyltransferase